MKPFVPLLIAIPLLLGGFLLRTGGAASSEPQQSAPKSLDTTVVLNLGQTVPMPSGEHASLRLDRINDSRCRPGKVCVWKGYVSYSFTYREGDAGNTFVLAEDMPGASKSATEGGLTFTLAETGVDNQVSLRVSNISPPSARDQRHDN